MLLKDFNEKLKENKDMQNSYVTLHRTLDTQIQALESATTINSSLITDLKKKKLQLKEHIELGTPLPVGTQRKLNSMLNSNKVERKSIRKQRKVTKHVFLNSLPREYTMSRNSVLWMQHEESYVHKVEIVHQTEVSCSNGHDTNYMKIREVYDSYGYKEPGRVVCELCGTTFRLMNPTLEE
jgi:hypothetical protein